MPRGLVSRDCDESLLKRARVTLSNAQMLDLTDTPATLLSAPGPGKVIQIVDALLYNPATGTAYTQDSADNLELRYATGSVVIAIAETDSGAVVSASGTPFVQRFVFAATTTTVYQLVINSAVELYMNNADLTLGVPPVDVILTYRVIDLDNSNGAQAAVAYATSVAV
jgi:hypothetical protein